MSLRKPMSLGELKNGLSTNNAKLKLIDIRSTDEYNKMHIPAAENIPVELLADASALFTKDDLIVCVCNKGHERSQSAAELLVNAGFENTYYLEGGTVGWFAPIP